MCMVIYTSTYNLCKDTYEIGDGGCIQRRKQFLEAKRQSGTCFITGYSLFLGNIFNYLFKIKIHYALKIFGALKNKGNFKFL